jgi:hypothetical protein
MLAKKERTETAARMMDAAGARTALDNAQQAYALRI